MAATHPRRRAWRAAAGGVALALIAGATAQLVPPPTRAAVAATGVNDSYSVSHDRILTVAAPGVLGNDLHLLGGTSAVLVSDVGHGTLNLLSSGRFTYQPTAGFLGTDQFRYRPTGLLSTAATVSIQVTNAAPVARNDSYTWPGGTLSVGAPGVLGNDTDADGDALVVEMVGGGISGSFDLNPDGSFQLHPGGGFDSGDTFQYRVSDGRVWSPPATVTLIIAAASPTPVPTPRPTPRPTPTPTPTPRPLPTVPLPSLPLPSLGGLVPTPRATSSPPPDRTAAPTPDPTRQPASRPPSTAMPRPTATPSGEATVPGPGAVPPGSGGDPDVSQQPTLRLPPREGIDLGLGLGNLDLGGFDTWAVPAATVGGVGLLVLLFVALQAGATVVWVPAVRRLRGERKPRRRRRR